MYLIRAAPNPVTRSRNTMGEILTLLPTHYSDLKTHRKRYWLKPWA
jgi:hypothetical protein